MGRRRRTIWTLTLDTGALTQVTYLDDSFSISLDARRQAHRLCAVSDRPALRATSLWSVLTDGQGTIEPIPAQWDAYPRACPSDGRTLYYNAYQSDQAQEDIVSVATGDTAAKPSVRLATPASEDLPSPSPDGRWLAYQTNASGRAEARLAPFTDLTAFVQVSTRGGSPIRWSRDGSRLYLHRRR